MFENNLIPGVEGDQSSSVHDKLPEVVYSFIAYPTNLGFGYLARRMALHQLVEGQLRR